MANLADRDPAEGAQFGGGASNISGEGGVVAVADRETEATAVRYLLQPELVVRESTQR